MERQKSTANPFAARFKGTRDKCKECGKSVYAGKVTFFFFFFFFKFFFDVATAIGLSATIV
jgi:hypothetical protein